MDEAHIIISNTLRSVGGFERLLMLYDIMIDTDTVRTLSIDDDLRITTICRLYGIGLLPADENKLIVDYLETIKQERRRMILLSGEGSIEARKAFIE